MTKIPEISVIIPVFNSQLIIPELLKRIKLAFKGSNLCYEIIIVNDCSSDGSWDVLKNYAKHEKINILNNEKNLGQVLTSVRGIQASLGKYIVTIDDDLEYNPSTIIQLYRKIHRSNLKVVFGIAKDKYLLQGKSTLLANFRNKLLNYVWSKPKTDSFKIFRRELVFNNNDCLLNIPFENFIKNIVQKYEIGYLDVGFNKRFSGSSNYSLLKKIRLFLQISFITK